MSIDIVERLRKMASIETSALYSQRKSLSEAAGEIERLRALAQQPLSVQEPVGWYRDPKAWVFHLSLGKDRPANGTSNPDEWRPIAAPTVGGKE